MFQTDELSCTKVVPRDEGSSIDVTLRCDRPITDNDKLEPLKAIGFIKPDEFLARLVLMHMGCGRCQRALYQLCG